MATNGMALNRLIMEASSHQQYSSPKHSSEMSISAAGHEAREWKFMSCGFNAGRLRRPANLKLYCFVARERESSAMRYVMPMLQLANREAQKRHVASCLPSKLIISSNGYKLNKSMSIAICISLSAAYRN